MLTVNVDIMRMDINQGLNFLFKGDETVEICALNSRVTKSRAHEGFASPKTPICGWFPVHGLQFDRIIELVQETNAEGYYWTLNPCNKALTGRADRRFKAGAARTSDKDIEFLSNMLIDCDPVRPAGVSSSDDEHSLALAAMNEIAENIIKEGLPEPLRADSGNGAHLIFKLPYLENTPENIELIKRCLQALSKRYSTPSVKIDEAVFNPSRLTKLYGTPVRKGDDTQDQPHRLSKVISCPANPEPVRLELLRALAEEAKDKVQISVPASFGNVGPQKSNFDLKAFLEKYSVTVKKIKPNGSSTLYILDKCVFDETHSNGESSIGQTAEGKLFYQCFHNSCQGKTWAEAKAIITGTGHAPPTGAPLKNFPQIQGFTAAALMAKKFEPIKWVIPGILPEGLAICGGNPKMRKSFLALNNSISVSTGGKAFGKIDVEKGEVLYLALEDGQRRLYKRISSCCQNGLPPHQLTFFNEWPRFDEGGLELLDKYLTENPGVRMVVIDTLAKLWPSKGKKDLNRTLYHADYDNISGIKQLADKHHVAILGIHHLRKNKDTEDPIEQLSGSMGISGAADTIMILKGTRNSLNANLLITGRDIEKERDLALIFDPLSTTWFLL